MEAEGEVEDRVWLGQVRGGLGGLEARRKVRTQAVERRTHDVRFWRQGQVPGADGDKAGGSVARQGLAWGGTGELGEVELTALGIGQDGDVGRARRRVLGEQLEGVESDQGAADGVGEGSGGGQADAQAGEGAGTESDGQEVEVGDAERVGREKVSNHGDERAAVADGGVGAGAGAEAIARGEGEQGLLGGGVESQKIHHDRQGGSDG